MEIRNPYQTGFDDRAIYYVAADLMTQLANVAVVKMMIEPYGTEGHKPFRIIDFGNIVLAGDGTDIATEFWQDPPRWGCFYETGT